MAIICLSRSISELKERISNIIIGKNYNRENVKFGDLKCTGAVAALLKDAIRPNLVQTLEKNPVFVHGGPFANIAHGCNSINATLSALATGDYVVTEAGFAADLGAEADKVGAAGSLTKVLGLSEPAKRQAGVKIQEESVEETMAKAIEIIAAAKVL